MIKLRIDSHDAYSEVGTEWLIKKCKFVITTRFKIGPFSILYLTRKGAGRKAKEPTVVMRIPVSKVEAVKKLLLKGKHPDLVKDPALKEKYPFYAMYHGNPPDVEYYQTKKYLPEELTHIQLYQTTSEGTPLSPVFRADELEKLCEWAADHATVFAREKATKEEWMKMLSNDFVYYARLYQLEKHLHHEP